MCGIAGVLDIGGGSGPADTGELTAMIGALHHRGPDESGLYRDAHIGLAHARLSIIDLTSGQQPMTDERGDLWVVYNGEIFDYQELRSSLLVRGHRFRTQSDTEVILAAYREWGDDCFRRFDGQFAIALWDATARRLILARDRLGVRPLFVAEHAGRLWFASEVKALFAGDPTMPRALDAAGLVETFTFWSTVAPQTVFQGVTELEPGHVRTYEDRQSVDRAWWAPDYPEAGAPPTMAFDAAVERVRDTLERAVALRMLRADVPVGCYVSGGLDSALIAALGRRAKSDRFATFSIRFADPDYDETQYQRQVVDAIGSDHHELVLDHRDIADAFPAVVEHAERPVLRTAPAPMFLLSRLVRDAGIKVVLTGEGADEMFAGYDLFREARVRRFWGRQPESRLRPLLLERLYPYLVRSPVGQRSMAQGFFGTDLDRWAEPGFGHHPRWRTTSSLQRLFTEDLRRTASVSDVVRSLVERLPASFARWSYLAQDQCVEVRTLLSGYLLSSQGDRMLMANSVEGRFPFLDVDVVDLANSLPDAWKLQGLNEKHIIKHVAKGIVPDAILGRSKQPYRAPDARTFVGPNTPAWVASLMEPRFVHEVGVFDPTSVSRLWQRAQSIGPTGRFSNVDDMALVGVLSVGLLYERLIRGAPPRTVPGVVRTWVDATRQAHAATVPA